MNKKEYYRNKIMYALQKIDYAKSKMGNKKHSNILSTIYFVLQNYNELDYLTLTKVMSQYKDKEIRKALRYLSDLGVVDWQGKRILKDKMIKLQSKDFVTFVKDLERKTKSGTGKERLSLAEIKDIIRLSEQECEPEPREEKQEKTVPEPKKADDEDWVSINYSDDLILNVKKSRLKKLLE